MLPRLMEAINASDMLSHALNVHFWNRNTNNTGIATFEGQLPRRVPTSAPRLTGSLGFKSLAPDFQGLAFKSGEFTYTTK